MAGLKFVSKKEFTCRYCGKQDWCYPRQIRKYCSQTCFRAAYGRAI